MKKKLGFSLFIVIVKSQALLVFAYILGILHFIRTIMRTCMVRPHNRWGEG
jgi:predicted secreted protein